MAVSSCPVRLHAVLCGVPTHHGYTRRRDARISQGFHSERRGPGGSGVPHRGVDDCEESPCMSVANCPVGARIRGSRPPTHGVAAASGCHCRLAGPRCDPGCPVRVRRRTPHPGAAEDLDRDVLALASGGGPSVRRSGHVAPRGRNTDRPTGRGRGEGGGGGVPLLQRRNSGRRARGMGAPGQRARLELVRLQTLLPRTWVEGGNGVSGHMEETARAGLAGAEAGR